MRRNHVFRQVSSILVLAVLICVLAAPASAAIGSIIAWGDDWAGQVTDVPEGNTFVAISAFSDTGVALKNDGSLVGWGNNGDPSDGRASPPSGSDYIAVSQGYNHGLALKSDGSIAGWGSNDAGQLTIPAGTDYTAVSAGAAYSTAIKSDGSLIGWGWSGPSGLCYPPSGTGYTNISTGATHGLALKSDGSIAGWGIDSYGQATPLAGTGFTAIAAGSDYSLALHSNGSIYGWGRNDNGQIDVPQDTGYVAISAGGVHALALHSNGSVIAWGYNNKGQTTVPPSSDYRAVSAGGSFSLAIMGGTIIPDFEADVTSGTEPLTVTFTDLSPSSPTSWTWDFGDGDLTNSTDQNPVHTYASAGTYTVSLTAANANGPGTTTKTDYITVSPRPPSADFTATPRYGTAPLEVQFTDTSAYLPTSWSWDFGDGSTSTLQNPSHTYPAAGLYTTTLEATNAQGSNTTSRKNYIRVFAHEPGAIAGWGGNNGHGEASPPAGSDYIAVDGGRKHSIALRANGSLVGWGDNEFGESTVPPGSDYIAIAAGRYHNYALRSNGSVVGWGDGSYNCLVDIPAGTDFTAISAGDAWGAALMSDGTIVQWGDYNFGLYPPPAGTGYSDLGGFYKQGLALSDDGRIVGWGQRTTAGLYPPPTGTGHTGLAQGEYHGLAVKGDGSVAMWGDDNSSQLHIPEGTYTAVAAGRDFSLALRTNGSIAQSGAVMGENNTAPAGDQYTAIAAGEFHSLAIGNIALTADFTGNKTVGVKPLVVQFTDATTGGTPTSWLWDFGDGDTTDATLRNPLHTYSSSGDYTVTLRVTNTMGSDTVIKPDYITVLDITAPPVADFTADITTGTVPMEVDFTDTSLNYPSSWSWDFGDGGTSTEQNPTHTYTTAGSFDVTLTATNSIGSDSEAKTGYITGITKPQADFTSNTTSGMRPLAVQFTDTSLYSPTIWTWDFGDGTSSGDKDPIHTYNTAGVYTVALRAANGAGSNWSNKTDYMTVAELEIQPVADFSANSTAGLIPFAVAFTDLSENTPTSWSWDFGDGGTSTEQDPVHVYTTPGVYSVTLVAANGGGSDSETRSSYITVLSPPTSAGSVGIFRSGTWALDFNGNFGWDGSDKAFTIGQTGDIPITGDWNNDGKDEIGIFRSGTWALDFNGNRIWDGGDKAFVIGQAGDVPVIGDWNGNGNDSVGIYRNGLWGLDYNDNYAWDGADKAFNLGTTGDKPVVGDWDASGSDSAGIFRNGLWGVDYNGNFAWDGADKAFNLGQAGDVPVVGDWDASGSDSVGIFRNGLWGLDYNGNFAWDGADKAFNLGQAGDVPVVGGWI